MSSKERQSHWIENLHRLYELSETSKKISVEQIVTIFSGRGVYFLVLLLTLPFCIPLPIPGLSTPFGLVIVFLSLRMLFRHHVSYPKWLLNKKISAYRSKKIASKLEKVFLFMEKFSHPRALFLIELSILKILHSLLFLVCGSVLALPLPIPMTNVLVAWPILFVAFGILQEDGLLVIVGYIIFIVALGLGIHFLG